MMNYKTFADDFDPCLKSPFSMIISGMSQSGKSTLTGEILARRNEIIDTPNNAPINKIIYCFSEYQPNFFKTLKDRIPQIEFKKGLPEEFADGSDLPSIIVLDDLMNEASKSEDTLAAFTRTSHHRNVSLIILVQNFFHKNIRPISTNCHYIAIMKNPRDSAFILHLGKQLNGGRKNEVMETAYRDCMIKKYGYIFIDCSHHQNDNYRIRDCVFPDNCIVYTNK